MITSYPGGPSHRAAITPLLVRCGPIKISAMAASARKSHNGPVVHGAGRCVYRPRPHRQRAGGLPRWTWSQHRTDAGPGARDQSFRNYLHSSRGRRCRKAPAESACAFSPCRKNCPLPDIQRSAPRLFCVAKPARSPAPAAAPEIRLDLNVGTVPVRFTQEPGQPIFGEMTQKDPEFGAIHNVDDIARLTGLRAADFDDSVPIQTVSTGVPFTIAALRSLKTLQNLRLDPHRAAEYLAPERRKVLLLCLPRDGRPQSPSACSHDFLQRRRSGHRFRCRLLRRVDGGALRCRQRGAGFDRARPRNAPSQLHFRSRHQAR